jgi:hypothetical protein
LLVERFNLAQQPMAFAENEAVKGLLARSGESALPITLVDGEVAFAGRYPVREDLARWLDSPSTASSGAETSAAAAKTGACCSGGTCC